MKKEAKMLLVLLIITLGLSTGCGKAVENREEMIRQEETKQNAKIKEQRFYAPEFHCNITLARI